MEDPLGAIDPRASGLEAEILVYWVRLAEEIVKRARTMAADQPRSQSSGLAQEMLVGGGKVCPGY